jgi:hypothetical protein
MTIPITVDNTDNTKVYISNAKICYFICFIVIFYSKIYSKKYNFSHLIKLYCLVVDINGVKFDKNSITCYVTSSSGMFFYD